MMRYFLFSVIAVLLIGVLPVRPSHALDVVVRTPFADSAYSPAQKDAWAQYLNYEAGKFGCRYGDDARLDARALMQTFHDIMSNQDMKPIRVTYRTWKNMTPSVRRVLSRNIEIASMDCRKIYVYEDDVLGVPMVPFEEYLSMMRAAYEAKGQDGLFDVIREIRVAPIDARYFFAFFSIPKSRMAFIGSSVAEMDQLLRALPKLMDINWVLSERNQKARKVERDEGRDGIYDLSLLYLQLPGAHITLPLHSPCDIAKHTVLPSLTIWPFDDPINDISQSPGDRLLGKEVLAAIRARVKAEEHFLETSTPYMLTSKAMNGDFSFARDDAPTEYALGFNVPLIGGGEAFKSMQYKMVGRCK